MKRQRLIWTGYAAITTLYILGVVLYGGALFPDSPAGELLRWFLGAAK